LYESVFVLVPPTFTLSLPKAAKSNPGMHEASAIRGVAIKANVAVNSRQRVELRMCPF